MLSLASLITTTSGRELWRLENMRNETLNLLKDLAAQVHQGKSQAEPMILNRFNDRRTSNSIVCYLRFVASAWLRTNLKIYQAFRYGSFDVHGYCKAHIESPDTKIDDLGMRLLIDILMKPIGVSVDIIYLDHGEGIQFNPNPVEAERPQVIEGPRTKSIVHLLYRPCHYDILYDECQDHSMSPDQVMADTLSLDVQMNSTTSFTHQHPIDTPPYWKSGLSYALTESQEPLESQEPFPEPDSSQKTPSSHESPDSIDSDLLSISEISEEPEEQGLYEDNRINSVILCEVLNRLLQECRAIKEAVSRGVAPSEHSSAAPVGHQIGFTSTSCQSSRTGRGRKRQKTDEDGKQDQAETALTFQSTKSKSRPRVLACPYWKRHPYKYRRCCKLTLKRIRDVKQHLHRSHNPKFYCERCFVTFKDHESHDNHVVSNTCVRESHTQLEGISHSQRESLSRKSNPKFTEENQWFAMWDIVFPRIERPVSAYVDPDLSSDICLFHEVCQTYGPDILLDTFRSNQWESMSAEDQGVSMRRILAEGLNRILDSHSSLSNPSTESQSSTLSTGIDNDLSRTSSIESPSSGAVVTPDTNDQILSPTGESSSRQDSSNAPNLTIEENMLDFPDDFVSKYHRSGRKVHVVTSLTCF
jgi:hypothetical protein